MRQLKSIFIILMMLALPSLAAAEQSSGGSNPGPSVVLHKASFTSLIARDVVLFDLGSISKGINGRDVVGSSRVASDDVCLPRKATVMKSSASEVTFRDITLTQAGTLASLLGDDITDIDSLVVRGPVNAEDLHTMWACSFYGGTTVINLEDAAIQDNKLPTNAFWYQSEQYTPGAQYIDCIPLRRIILPEGLTEIGELAFSYAIALEDINLPSSLRAIKRSCFSDCVSLNVDPLVIPEGMEEIGYLAFLNCSALRGRVVLPSTMKRIAGGAFFQCKISECNFPEGLEEIGDAAFYASRLKEVTLPNTCRSFPGDSHFKLNYELERVVFPEGVTVIPDNFVDNCSILKEFRMPDSVEEIGGGAFWQCGALEELRLSSNLKSIGTEGLYYCKGLKAIDFPSSLESLGAEGCEYWKNIKEIRCAAQVPPTCMESSLNPGCTPFGSRSYEFINDTPRDTPVYVPIGSADLYCNAWGWNYFTNYIEMDFSGIKECMVDEEDTPEIIYDLYGRKVTNPLPNQIYIKNGKKIYIKN